MGLDPRLIYSDPRDPAVNTAARIAALDKRVREAAVSGGTLGAGAVINSNMAPGSVTGATIAAGTIVAGNIAAGTITANLIAANTIVAGNIAAGTITGALIAATTILGTNIAAGTIYAVNIATATITATNIAANTITATNIAANAITATQIAAGTITAAKLVAGTITANEIAAGTITGSLVAAGTITATNIAAGTITGSLIAAGTITGDRLVSGTITATQISVASLSAISANMGTVTAGTITGALFQSSASNPRAYIDATGVGLVNAAGVTTFKADTSTGKVSTLAGIGGGNLLANSSFENPASVTPWAAFGGNPSGSTVTTVDTVVWTGQAGPHGSRSARVYTGAGGQSGILQTGVPVTVGQVYTASCHVIADEAGAIGGTVTFIDSAGAAIGTGNWWTDGVASGTAWSRHAFTVPAAPPGALTAYVYFFATAAGAAKNYYFDACQLEPGSLLTAYAPKPDEILPATVEGGGGAGQIKPSTVAGADLVVDSVTAREIAAATITGVKIAANTITAGKLVAGTITAVELAAGAITAAELSATAIDAMTITGATFRTAASNPRVQIDSAGITKYDGSGNAVVRLANVDGLDLLAGVEVSPPSDRRVRWLAGTTSVCEIFGSYQSGASYGYLRTIKTGFTNPAYVGMGTVWPDGSSVGALTISSYATWGLGYIGALIEGYSKAILRGNGTSDFAFTASDARDKSQISSLPSNALEQVRALRPVGFRWKPAKGPDGPQVGFVAQEVEEVIPEAVFDSGDRKAMHPFALIAVLAGALQQLDSRFSALESRDHDHR